MRRLMWIYLVLICLLIMAQLAVASKPNVTSAWTSPNPFSPNGDNIDDTTKFHYVLADEARVTIKVFDYKGEVKTLVSNVYRAAGRQSEGWAGADNQEKLLPNGNYKYEIFATNRDGDVRYPGIVSINNPMPTISNVWSNPNPYAPNGGGLNPELHFTLAEDARVTIKVFNNKGEVARIAANEEFSAGSMSIGWTGINKYGKLLTNGNYRYEITATNKHGTCKATAILGIKYLPPSISQAWVSPSSWSPNGDGLNDSTSFCYTIKADARVTIKVFNYKGEVKTIINRAFRSAGRHYEGWTGTDNQGNILPNGNYKYVIFTTNRYGENSFQGVVRINFS